MSGDQNDKATCSNSSPPHQQEENFVQDNTTTSGTDGNTTTSATEAGNTTTNATEAGNATTDGTRGKKRKQIRERRLNELSTKREDVYEVSLANGEPINPEEVAANYGGQCGCILRTTVSIKDKEIRKNVDICTYLLKNLHKRYTFPKDYNNLELKTNLVNRKALGKFSRDLSSWKSRVRRLVDEKKSYTEVHKKYPTITEADWETFKRDCKTEEVVERRKWGEKMRNRNIGIHGLGSRGYERKRKMWAKEDANPLLANKHKPWAEFEEGLQRDFIRARCHFNRNTMEYETDDKTKKLIVELVIYLS